MKKFGLIYVFVVALFATSCNDELVEQQAPAADGSEIIFGGRAGFEGNDPDSRTVYAGKTYDHDNKTFERIDWVVGDKIEIYSEEASNGPSAHYSITSITAGDENAGNSGKGSDYGYLESLAESSLQWNGDGDHTFYAMYPSASMFIAEDGTLPTVAQGIMLDKSEGKVVVKGTVPSSQPGTVTESDGNFTVNPDMKYAYMVAKSTANRAEGLVGLSFVPIVTAVEVEMIVPTNADKEVHNVMMAEIQVTGTGIAGDFTADLTSWDTTGYPTCTNVGDGQGVIQISTWVDNKPITITEGKSVKFTVFMRPGANPDDLKVSYSPTGSGYVSKPLKGVTIPAKLKTRIKNLNLPATYDTQIVVDASKWMSQLSGDLALKKLSIPGTGGTFSYNYNSSNPGWYKQQTLTLDEQWAVGIRAFEIVSDRPSSSSTTLGTQDVKCNEVSMGVTVLSVLQQLLKKVTDNNTETAVLILTYQPEGVIGNARNASNYASSLKLMYDGLETTQQEQIIQYKPDLTLEEARGNVMILCRINQKDENDGGSFADASQALADTKITLIDGCGTGKDRWGSRGYKVQGNSAYDAANTSDAAKSVDYYLTQHWGAGWSWPDWTNVTRGDLAFGFSTNYSGITCWYQEWARVVPASLINANYGWFQVNGSEVWGNQVSAHNRWYESYDEKVAAAEETFRMAISDNYPSYIFINSLCGYLVDKDIPKSYGIFDGSNDNGIAGNIKALADKINPAFYQYVLGAGMEQTTGPTGIVMMDYVTNKPTEDEEVEYDGSYYLPGVIIANNFKFGNGSAGGGNTEGGGNGSDEGEEEEG